jgi:hypothetical protein
MHKNATKCNKTLSKWYINKHGASKIIDMFEMYQRATVCEMSLGAELIFLLHRKNQVFDRVFDGRVTASRFGSLPDRGLL